MSTAVVRVAVSGTSSSCADHVVHVQIKEKSRHDGTLLPHDDPRAARVVRIGSRIVKKAGGDFGGGSTAHLEVISHP
jgi:hypothetical protein